MSNPELWLIVEDIHYPEHDRRAVNAVFHFLDENKVDGLIINGDGLDFSCVSHHVPKQARKHGALKSDLDGFDKQILRQFETRIPKTAKKVFGKGNHERFLDDFLNEENPELAGITSIEEHLKLKERGWKVLPVGYSYPLGRLNVLHGDSIGTGQYAAKKALDIVGDNVLMGHGHQMQSFSKTSPIKAKKKICAWMCGCLCNLAQNYGKGRANAWVHGFALVYVDKTTGQFNVYPVVIIDGKLLWNGKCYGAR
jgi:predicted phosphodiesterase